MCYNQFRIRVTIGHIFMKSKQFLQLIIVCFALFCSSAVQAAGPSAVAAKNWAEDKGNLLLETFQGKDLAVKYKKLDELFLQYVDLPYISKFVIGKHWREMTSEQQKRYQDLFTRYALGTYKGFPLSFEYPITFKINNADVCKNYTDVWAFIDLGDNLQQQDGQLTKQINVMFRLTGRGNNIKIIDIKLAESSLILSYRNRFYQMVAGVDGDMEWFLEDLENSVVSTEKVNQLKLQNNSAE